MLYEVITVIAGGTDKTVTIMNPTSVTVEGQPQIVTSEPIVFTGGTSTVTNGKLTITNVTALSILNGIITVVITSYSIHYTKLYDV